MPSQDTRQTELLRQIKQVRPSGGVDLTRQLLTLEKQQKENGQSRSNHWRPIAELIELDPSARNPYEEEKHMKMAGDREQVSPSDIYLQTSQDLDI